MQKKAALEIYRNIESGVTGKDFLANVRMAKKSMQELIPREEWIEAISEAISGESLTCGAILKLCRKSLSALADEPQEGWLKYLYDYTIGRLYPEKAYGEDLCGGECGAAFLFKVMRCFFEYEKQKSGEDPLKYIHNLTHEEVKHCPTREEYAHYLKMSDELYLYEFMRIGREVTPYKLLDHIAGVHSLAMHIAKQIGKKGVPIDLALMSGAAACHDIGKFGCKDSENGRVPYLHYYYTDQCMKRFGMPSFAHIAANHSTWDLELENLSVESLILIYSDFRIKDRRNADGEEEVHIFTLSEAFGVILGKLDNVDEAKKRRYIKVYSKIRDFENYMTGLGVDVNFSKDRPREIPVKDPAIMNSGEVIERLKALAIEHNIRVMSIFNNESAFGNLIEEARGETQWKNIRAYINIFEEYSTYMNQKQKIMTLQLLYEMLMHREGDIRRQAASLMGKMIAGFDEEYRKETPSGALAEGADVTGLDLWKKYLHSIIFPDHKVTEQHKRWIGYSFRIIIISLFNHCGENEKRLNIEQLLNYYTDADIDDATAFVLIDSMPYIPLELCSAREREGLMLFALKFSGRAALEIRAGALNYAEYLTRRYRGGITGDEGKLILSMIRQIPDEVTGIVYLKMKILRNIGEMPEKERKYASILNLKKDSISEIFLENLKVGTPWIVKIINIEFLLELSENGNREALLHIATHFSNLIKVSERVTVRHGAGEGLLEIIKRLRLDERNEIVIELTKGLEIGEYEVSKYIPEYLGKLALYLHPNELDELISSLKKLQESTNDKVSSVTLNTLGRIVQNYSSYKSRFGEGISKYEARRDLILGMLLRGLSNYGETVSQEAFFVIGKYFFAPEEVSREEKYSIFENIYKKMLTLLSDRKETKLSLFNNAAVLNDIYRFISDYLLDNQDFSIRDSDRIAFFPGTFDPFSLSHKGIVRTVRDLGFEVYLALDEFSWSKKTQARMIRRQIITMSIADENNVYVFPDDIPVNLANPSDLKRLNEIWPGREVYITVGSDVIANASSYKAEPAEYSIHNFNHVVFRRVSDVEGTLQLGDFPEQYNKITGDVIELTLPLYLEDISSTRIRENIDLNRDISNLIDPVVQNFIYDNSLYLREPQYKQVMQGRRISVTSEKKVPAGFEALGGRVHKKGNRYLMIRDGEAGNDLAAMCVYKELKSADIYGELKDQGSATYIREHASGKIVIISYIYFSTETGIREPVQTLLTEVLAECLKSEFTYAVYDGELSDEIVGALERQGFERLDFSGNMGRLYAVDMKFPMVLLKNMETNIKAPFNENGRVIAVIDEAHKKMQAALSKLYPGGLVLSISSDVLHNKLVSMIVRENGVPPEQYGERRFGPLMCVPFGEMLKGKTVPNTVTKALHTEKVFNGSVNGFKIKEFPYYSPIINQVRTIKSFNRPIILLDDFLHKGYRIRELDPVLKRERINVEKIVVGILSGRGKDLMEIQHREVESAYYIPNLRNWFVETGMYPFIGGDSIETSNVLTAGIIPSVNLILPYVAPRFLLEGPKRAVFELSMTCLQNTRDILEVLEEEYQAMFERNLTLNRLSEVISTPRMPERGYCVRYDMNLPPSVYVSNDIELLIRLENILL